MNMKEIVHCAKQIERSHTERSYGNILTLLGDLNKMSITAEQLEATDVVRTLYRLLKSCSDDGMKRTTKSLLSKWKRQHSKGARGVKGTEEEEEEREDRPRSGEAGDEGVCRQGDSHSGLAQTQERKCAEQEASSSGVKHGPQALSLPAESDSSSSSVRSKCAQLLLVALSPEIPDQERAAELSRDIERSVHELHKSSQVKYKACVRSKVANLRNPKNKHLHQGLLSGSLSPEAFARMSVEDMASPELRQLREEYSSRGVSERQLPQGVEGTQTQRIRCKRCGGSDCRVTQVSRGTLFLPAWVRQGGPDDDAMTFVTCSGCGQQWYHSGWVCL